MDTCVWEPDPACLGDKWESLDIDVRDRSLMLATSALQMLTLNRVGTCPVKVRPCYEERPCGHDWEPYRMMGSDGTWLNRGNWLNPCGCRTARWCAPASEVDLEGPVGYVAEVKVDGEPLDLDSGDWRLDNGHLLVWQGSGPSPIPRYQDLSKPDTEVGTWSVSYSQSYPVGQDAKMAVAYLALEFAKACEPKGKCALPRGVRTVTRMGVNFTLEAGLFPNGLTGIDIVDQFILKWTPPGSPQRSATVFSPRNRGNRRTSSLPRPMPEQIAP